MIEEGVSDPFRSSFRTFKIVIVIVIVIVIEKRKASRQDRQARKAITEGGQRRRWRQ